MRSSHLAFQSTTNSKYVCDQCDYQTSWQSDHIRHIETKHKVFNYTFDQCDFQGTTKGSLKVPSSAETETNDDDEGLLSSKFATRKIKATTQSNLKTHMKSKHESVKFACHQCDFQGSDQSNLKRHTEGKHEGVKYACHLCDYQASWKKHLKTHIESKHEGVKYHCSKLSRLIHVK